MTPPDTAAPGLAYVTLASRDPAATIVLFETHLGLARQELAGGGDSVAAFAVGASAVLVAPLGHALVDRAERPGVHHIALCVAEPADRASALGPRGIATLGAARPGPDGRERWLLDPEATAGVRTYLAPELALERTRCATIERIDHIGIASADNEAAIAAFCRRLDCPRESEQTDIELAIPLETFTSDKYGVVAHTRPPEPRGALRSVFITLGDCELEFLQDFDPREGAAVEHGTPGTTRQDRGAIARYVASHGSGLHHLALKTPAIDPLLARLDAAGVALIDRRGRPGSRRALIGFIEPRGVGGILIHLVERS
jgi:catechol 2,3-dioxygenase-like lactoylglutathione lyase family enzyme